MKESSRGILSTFAAGCIVLFALDSQTAITAAKDAVILCGQAVIPALFPIFFLCILLTGNVQIQKSGALNARGGLSRNVLGSPLLLTCFLGGYPAGAQSVAQVYKNRSLSRYQASRLLACCNQAGPAFIFGILGSQFESKFAPWALWLVQILSITVMWFLFGASVKTQSQPPAESRVFPAGALSAAIRAIARVCGWVILFRCLIGYMNKYMVFPDVKVQILISGLLELTNGCLLLSQIISEPIRFILCSVLLTFGGICVTFQTKSVIGDLPVMPYIGGKILQSLIAFILAVGVSALLYHANFQEALWIPVLIGLCIVSVYGINIKKQ